MSAEVKEFYSNDIVYRFDKRKRITFGVVVDSYEDSTDSDERHALQKGQIRILWVNNSREQIWRQNKVRLMSRNIIPGDIVRRLVHGKETQRGYCKEFKQLATVQIVGTDKIIEKVVSERLNTVSPYDVNAAVCLGDKFGRIQNFDQLVTMRSKCGSSVQVLSSVNHDIEDYWLTKRNRGYFEMFYPGQEVTCTPHYLEQPHWILRTKAMKRNMQSRQRFTVQKVEPSAIEVAWYDYPSNECTTFTELTPTEIKQLKILGPLENNYLELAERRLLKLTSADTLLKKRDWMHKQSALHRSEFLKVVHVVNRTTGKRGVHLCNSSILSSCLNNEVDEDWWTEEAEDVSDNESSSSATSLNSNPKRGKYYFPPKPKDLVLGRTLPVEVLCIESKATIVWQDGTEERDIPSTQLYYSISLDDHEFFPGEWVIMANEKESAGIYGAVQVVNYLERTATVKWFACSTTEDKPVLESTTEISVYDLKKHSKYAFRPGSVVKSKKNEDGKLGYVIDSCPEGYVVVQWLEGVVENCWPQIIELLPDTVDYAYSYDDNDDRSQVSWETESIESIAGDMTDETTLQNMAARLDFVRNRIVYLKEVFRHHHIKESFAYLRDLLMVYDNSSYLDKLLDTSFFSPKSKHYQVKAMELIQFKSALMSQVREKAKCWGVEFRGRLFSIDNQSPSTTKVKMAEKENINKVVKLEHKINAQLESNKETSSKDAGGEPLTPLTPESDMSSLPHENLCIELLSMLKARMDLAYAEIISRIGGAQAFSVMTKASETNVSPISATPVPSFPTTPDDSFTSLNQPTFTKQSSVNCEKEPYTLLDEAPTAHHFYSNKFEPTDKQRFFKAVQKECKLLRESLPPGVWIRSYANRLDLLSVMIMGPNRTPYEDGLFLFDLQLSADYPRSPPVCHYISYSSERLNPNLYVEGRVCVSLLGTWMGRGTEVWGPNSTLLQLIVSIQGLILVSEPYYNEAGYEKQTESQQGYENSRTYNELVVLKMVQSMTEMLQSPPEVFKKEIYAHFLEVGEKMCDRLTRWCSDSDPLKPDFPLLPVSKGLKLSLTSSLEQFKLVLNRVVKEDSVKS